MGVIGKRVVDAVAEHPGLQLVAVGVRRLNGAVLARPDLPYRLTEGDGHQAFVRAGLDAGDWRAALRQVDIVVDAGPSRTGAGRAESYRENGVAVRYCGGERDPKLGPVLHSSLNRAVGRDLRSARLASCNTTALGRVIAALGPDRIRWAHATVVRCCTDTDKANKGVTAGAVFDARSSHHARDLTQILPGLPLTSQAVTVPMVCGHVILLNVEFDDPRIDVPAQLSQQPGITTLAPDQAHHSADLREESLRRSFGRGDRHAVAVQAGLDGGVWRLALSLDNESITVPETIDALVTFKDAGSGPPGQSPTAATSFLTGNTPSAAVATAATMQQAEMSLNTGT
jgi:glyceraldehyde-3-phosphate dehydrogenase (NAD(P))